MKVICVDDEPLVLQLTVSMCEALGRVDSAEGFTRADDALKWLERHRADVALLDIDMPDMDGITLATRLKRLDPDIAIVFLTAYREYAYDAFAARPSGYVLKPVSPETLEKELDYAVSNRRETRLKPASRIVARTFGAFELLVDGRPVVFRRARSKELLAYLVDRQGAGVSRPEAFAALWGDAYYDHSMQKQLDVYVRSLRATLQEYGAEAMFELKKGVMRVLPEAFDCDVYRLLAGDAQAANAYRGEYMTAYPWAALSEGRLNAFTRIE